MNYMFGMMSAALLMTVSPAAAQTAQRDHGQHTDHGDHHQGATDAQPVDQTVVEKKVIVRRVHKTDDAAAIASTESYGAPGTQCEGKIAETILDSDSKIAEGRMRKFKVTRCTEHALTAEQKIAELEALRVNVGGSNFPESDAETKAAFLQAIDARIAELKQPSS